MRQSYLFASPFLFIIKMTINDLNVAIQKDASVSVVSTDPLFKPLRIGAWELDHRVVLAPLTRCRSIKVSAQSSN
jgi:hypothetical protein